MLRTFPALAEYSHCLLSQFTTRYLFHFKINGYKYTAKTITLIFVNRETRDRHKVYFGICGIGNIFDGQDSLEINETQ